MAETAAEIRAGEAVYTTSRALGTGTTSTMTMQIWRLLTDHLLEYQKPVGATALGEATGLSLEEIEHIFAQAYYQKYYGFRRFDSYQAWEEWAMTSGALYNPELHDVQPEDEPELDDEVDDEGDEDEE